MVYPWVTEPPMDMRDAPDTSGGASARPQDDRNDQQQLAWLVSQEKGDQVQPYHYLLIMRFALVNLVAFSMLGAAYLHGLVDKVLAADQTYISVLIFIAFLSGLAMCAWRIWQTSAELNQVKRFNPLVPSQAAAYLVHLRGRSSSSRGIYSSALRLRLSQRIAVVRHVANSLVLLGLIGTVVGFIIALSGVDPAQASDVKAITPMVSTLIEGMSTALYTTLVGAILNVWLMITYHMLAGGTVKLITALIEFGEEHAQT